MPARFSDLVSKEQANDVLHFNQPANHIEVMAQVQAGAESSAVNDGGVLTPAWEVCIITFYKQIVTQLSGDGRADSV